ncbi:hypothetical protein ACLOJK_006978 [Asimina triloba]
MQQRFRQAYTTLRERGCVSYAKIATMGGFCDLDFILIRATAPDDIPLAEKHVQELAKIVAFSPSSSRAFSLCFTRRFGKTRCWRVALKCLALLHRLLRSLPHSNTFRSDLLCARSNGLFSLNPCRFRDAASSPSTSHAYTRFIRSYAHFLDEALDCIMIEHLVYADDRAAAESLDGFSEKMKEVGRILDVVPQLQSLLDRVMDCQPTGAVARSFVVRSAMKQIIRDSFACYEIFRREIVVLLDNLFQMQYRGSISTLRIYKKAAAQASRLVDFYEDYREMGLCGAYEYPFVDKIPEIHVRALEAFINEMWQLTESSSNSVSTSETESVPSAFTDDRCERQAGRLETVISTDWETFEADEDEPLIRLEDGEDHDDVNWEALLEASARTQCPGGCGNECRFSGHERSMEDASDSWQLQVYNPYTMGPFFHFNGGGSIVALR